MPGAQPRRPFETRVASTARRGAHAPPGVPGVYRVPRSQVVTVQADPGAPGQVSDNPWIQPDVITFSPGVFTRRFDISAGGTAGGDYIDAFLGEPPENVVLTSTFQCNTTAHVPPNSVTNVFAARIWKLAELAPFTPDVGDWPPGATGVEFETPYGTLIEARLSATLNTFTSPGYGGTYHLSGLSDVYALESGNYRPTWHTPTDLAGLTILGTQTFGSGSAVVISETFLPADLPAEEMLMVVLHTNQHLIGTASDTFATAGTASASLQADYTPPRYRFTF